MIRPQSDYFHVKEGCRVQRKIKILGFVGSLRKESYNKALMRAAIELVPDNAEIEVFDLTGIPAFNQDMEDHPQQIVKDFKAKIKNADALLIATPEYNYSVPGVLKNAIDAASRPYADKVFEGKTVAIMSASTGRFGGARAQYHLRQSLIFLNMYPVNKPEVMVAQAYESVDEKGNLINEDARRLVRKLLEELVRLTKKLNIRKDKTNKTEKNRFERAL